ncbi:MAG TPA: ACP S-malonyltransferase [Gemmatimonadales bacterium]|nr:ACP S-malonyltransferase [Gemmatimonadales bacterium]
MVAVVMCPGQGAQKIGMGKDLAERFPEARHTFEAIDDALGVPLSRIMWEGPDDELVLTHNTQPAILAHSAAVHAVVRERLGTVMAGAGHSLGEYSAYVAAGSLTAPDAARLVRRRGELMHEAGTRRPGAMSAVLGLDPAGVAAACAEASGDDGVAVAANLNSPDQIVISGDPVAVARAGEGCKARGAKRVIPLKVSGAFHSPLMEPAVPGLQAALASAAFAAPAFPIVANASAEAVRTPADAVRLLAAQLTAPVRWIECMQAAAALAPDATFIELGPGSVLSGLLRKILPGARSITLGTAAEVEAFLG